MRQVSHSFLIFLVALLLGGRRAGAAGLVVQDIASGQTPAGMVATLLTGSGITATNITYNGASLAAGTFSGGNGIIGFNQGIILSSGMVSSVPGPCVGTQTSTGFGTPGDPDLSVLAGVATNDAAVLEFDFVPQGSQLYFQYVFASVEYPEFVDSFNDPFGFFVNGIDAALVPGTSLPVTISNVNNVTNSAYYIDNTSCSLNLQMDGLTTVLGVTVTVNAGVTNHIKLAVADAVDTVMDSVVFIEAGSFRAPTATSTPTITSTFTSSPTRTLTLTQTSTYTTTMTYTHTPTISPTFTPSPTATVTPTCTQTLTFTPSPTFSFSPTITPTFTISPTLTVTPTGIPDNPAGKLEIIGIYPHPVPASGAIIAVMLPMKGDLYVRIYTLKGQLVKAIDKTFASAGSYEVAWDAKNDAGNAVAFGSYYLHIILKGSVGDAKVSRWITVRR